MKHFIHVILIYLIFKWKYNLTFSMVCNSRDHENWRPCVLDNDKVKKLQCIKISLQLFVITSFKRSNCAWSCLHLTSYMQLMGTNQSVDWYLTVIVIIILSKKNNYNIIIALIKPEIQIMYIYLIHIKIYPTKIVFSSNYLPNDMSDKLMLLKF